MVPRTMSLESNWIIIVHSEKIRRKDKNSWLIMERAAGKAVTNVNQVIREPCGNAVPQLSHGEFQNSRDSFDHLDFQVVSLGCHFSQLYITLNSYTSISRQGYPINVCSIHHNQTRLQIVVFGERKPASFTLGTSWSFWLYGETLYQFVEFLITPLLLTRHPRSQPGRGGEVPVEKISFVCSGQVLALISKLP